MELEEIKKKLDESIGKEVYYSIILNGQGIVREKNILQKNNIMDTKMVLSYLGESPDTPFCVNGIILQNEDNTYLIP